MEPTFRLELRHHPIYALADLDKLGSSRFLPAVSEMVEAGIRWIQIRAKNASGAQLFHLAEECERRLRGASCSLWLNDRIDIAAMLPVDGIHLGQRDLPPAAARKILGKKVAIGLSTHNRDQVLRAIEDPHVDVVAVGPVFPTESKLDADPAVGLDLVKEARRLTQKPIVAIGGLSAENLCSVLAAGADLVALLGAVCGADTRSSCSHLLQTAKECS